MAITNRTFSQPIELNGTFSTIKSKVLDLEDSYGISVQANYTDGAPAAKTFKSAVAEVQTVTLPAFSGFTDRDYFVVQDTVGVSYAVYGDKTGTSAAPTGAAYVAATYKVRADLSAATTATEVTTAFAAAINTLTGFTAAITTSGTTTLILTQVLKATVVNPVVKSFDDAGAGAITGVETTAGILATVDQTNDYITIASHGYVTGTKAALSTSSALPAGTAAQDYWLVVIDASTVGLATSLALATAGTLVNITGDGTGTHTLTPTAATGNVFKAQKSNDGVVWTDISTMTVTSATTTLSTWFEIASPTYKYIKLIYTPTAGQAVLVTTICQKT